MCSDQPRQLDAQRLCCVTCDKVFRCVAQSQICFCYACSTRAFMFPKKPGMTPAEALSILAKLEAASKSESEESYV